LSEEQSSTTQAIDLTFWFHYKTMDSLKMVLTGLGSTIEQQTACKWFKLVQTALGLNWFKPPQLDLQMV
jgi:hypothetical protein